VKSYPICIVGLDRRRVVVVGGGAVAERKVAGLLEAGAQVTVIGPRHTPQLRAWGAAGTLVAVERPYAAGDLDGAFLAVAATDDPAANEAVCRDARAAGCLVNAVEGSERGDYIVPAVIRRGEITIAVGTGGASPALARHLRRRLEEVVGPEYAGVAALLAGLRPYLLDRLDDERARSDAVEGLLAAGLPDLVRDLGEDGAMRRAMEMLDALLDAGSRDHGAPGERGHENCDERAEEDRGTAIDSNSHERVG
jgi:precorrin-2 dehydrogenase / sirohydrochlorin ferrochelatase